MTRGSLAHAVGGLVVLVCAASADRDAAAQITEPETWRFQCMTDSHSEEQEICTTEIMASQDGDDFLIYFVHADKGTPPLVVDGAEVPFRAAVITVDDEDPISTGRCEVGLCYYDTEASRVLLKQFRKGLKARVQVETNDESLRLDREITLRGFSATYDKYRTRER
jgi:invasion protein IalB